MKVHGPVRQGLTGALLAALSSSLLAMSLGGITVTSPVGQPLTLMLGLKDVQATMGTIKLRVASEEVYREYHLPYFASYTQTRLVYDRADPERVSLAFAPDVDADSLDIVMSLSQGNSTELKRFHLKKTPTTWVVSELPLTKPEAPSPTPKIQVMDVHSPQAQTVLRERGVRVKVEPTAVASTEKAPSAPSEPVKPSEKASALSETPRVNTPVTPKLTKANAPEIVAAFVKKHGFNPKEAFPVGENMTLWSVAKLYWPSYPGATLEQLLLAFRAKNPTAFEKGSLNEVLPGSRLVPPSQDEVLAMNPYEAFYEVHGAHTAIPPTTQALMDQWDVARRHAKSDVKEEAERVKKDEPHAAPHALSATALPKADVNAAVNSAEEAMALKPDVAQERPFIGEAAVLPEVNPGVAVTNGQPVVPSAVAQTSHDSLASTPTKAEEPGTHAVDARDLVPMREATEQVEKAQQAQEAAQSPQEEKVTSGFDWKYLLLALGLLGLWLGVRRWIKGRQAKLEEAKKHVHPMVFQATIAPMDARQKAALEATCEQAVKQGTTAGAMGVGLKVYAEMEDDVPASSQDTPGMEALLAKSKALIESVDLPKDLPLEGEEPEPEEPDWASVQKQLTQYLARQDATTLTPIERALNAKLKLAQHFVEQGAVEEAKALLEEVHHRGSPEQIQLASRLLGQPKRS